MKGQKGTACPYCGQVKVGLADHLRDKHGPNQPKAPGYRSRLIEAQLDCPDCGAPMKLRHSVYGLFYGCTEWETTGCKGSHIAHRDGRPMGVPADSRTKKMRMAAHNTLDPLWQEGGVFPDRDHAYIWMQQALGMTPAEAHIGQFDEKDCTRLIEAIWATFGD